jgi:hypothetical protein
MVTDLFHGEAVTEFYNVDAKAVYQEDSEGGIATFVEDLEHRQGPVGREDDTVVIFENGYPVLVSTITGKRV